VSAGVEEKLQWKQNVGAYRGDEVMCLGYSSVPLDPLAMHKGGASPWKQALIALLSSL
jgi:hypothetical protein